MTYSVDFTAQAEKDLALLDKVSAQNITNKIDWLLQNFEGISTIPLKGKYKLRIGDWRVIYSIEHPLRIITIYAVRHRSEVYRI